MTQEEKARAYDEALERAREALNDGTISNNAIAYLQDIFPELAESEDERIRKSIIEHLQSDIDDMSKSDCPFDFEAEIEELSKYIAWLEKQGKSKWSEEDEDNLNLAIYHIRCDDIPYSPHDVEPIVDWLNSIKQRLGGEES